MKLVVTLRKEVPDRETGEWLYNLIKERLADHPEVIISGHVTNHFDMENPPDEPG